MNPVESDYYDFPGDWSSSQLTQQISSLNYRERRRLNWVNIRPPLERHLFRYSAFDPNRDESVARLEDILIQSRFWLASPEDFNDPFDCKGHVIYEADPRIRRNKFDQVIRAFEPNLSGLERRRKIDQMMTSKSPQEWHKAAIDAITRNANALGVTCFSRDPRSLLMWSHYANNHTGVCFQFETLRDTQIFSTALPVRYTTDYPKINYFNYTPNELFQLMLSKFKHWEYEEEHRIVAISAAHKWLRFAPSALTGVILGAKSKSHIETKLRDLLQVRSTHGLPPIQIYRAIQHLSSYRLVIERVN